MCYAEGTTSGRERLISPPWEMRAPPVPLSFPKHILADQHMKFLEEATTPTSTMGRACLFILVAV